MCLRGGGSGMQGQHILGQLFVGLLLVCSSKACFGQTVVIRVLNGVSGTPLADQDITVSFLNSSNGQNTATAPVHLRTDRKGNASVQLPDPAPRQLWVEVKLTSETWHCGCKEMVSTQDVLSQGFTEASATKVGGGKGKWAGPGEVVFLARRYGFWERLLYPIERE